MAIAAARVAIDFVDELPDGGAAIADDVGRFAAGSGDEAFADDEHAIVVAGCECFDDDRGVFGDRGFVGGFDLLAAGEVHGDAAAVVAELRLDDDRLAELLRGDPGVGGACDGATFGNRHADVADQRARELLVLRDELGDGTGAIGLGGADVAELGAIAKLHQAAAAEADAGECRDLWRHRQSTPCSGRGRLRGPGR